MKTTSRKLGRREFIKRGALAGLGVGLMSFAKRAVAAIPVSGVKGYHELRPHRDADL